VLRPGFSLLPVPPLLLALPCRRQDETCSLFRRLSAPGSLGNEDPIWLIMVWAFHDIVIQSGPRAYEEMYLSVAKPAGGGAAAGKAVIYPGIG